MKNTEEYALWAEGLPVVRGGKNGRGRVLLRGSSLTDGTNNDNADYIRSLLNTKQKIWIDGLQY